MNAVRRHVRVRAPARLHLGFLDPDATLGRRFGSIGVAIDGFATEVTAEPAAALEVSSAAEPRAAAMVTEVLASFALPQAMRIDVSRAIPAHAGLGSGTQLALALGTALTGLYGEPAPPEEIAARLERGRRSGIGLALFTGGGLVVDGGRGPVSSRPPVVVRAPLPPDWRVVLVRDDAHEGLNGAAESAAFGSLPRFERAQAAELCHRTLMGLLPALAEGDFAAFSEHVGAIQAAVGDHFTPAQQGRYTSPAVAEAIALCEREFGLAGVGQSSWGPTAFAFVPDAAAGERVVNAVSASFHETGTIHCHCVAPLTRGASVELAPLVLADRRLSR